MGTIANESLEIETTGLDLHDETTEAMIVAASEAELVDSVEVENTIEAASEIDAADDSAEIESEVVADVIELKPEDLPESELVEAESEEVVEIEASGEAVDAENPETIEVKADAQEEVELEASEEAVLADSDLDSDSTDDSGETVEVVAESEKTESEDTSEEAIEVATNELEADAQEVVELEATEEAVLADSDDSIEEVKAVAEVAESEEASEEAAKEEKPSRSRALLLTSLLSTTKPISLKELKKVLKLSEKAVLDAIADLKTTLYEQDLGLMMEEVAGGYRVIIQPALYADLAELIAPPPLPQLSGAALETLAIIGYKQPITRGELEAARGTGCSSTLDTLQERDLIKIVGQKDVVGKPLLYGTTERFLLEFGLKSLEDLPPLDDKPTEFLRS